MSNILLIHLVAKLTNILQYPKEINQTFWTQKGCYGNFVTWHMVSYASQPVNIYFYKTFAKSYLCIISSQAGHLFWFRTSLGGSRNNPTIMEAPNWTLRLSAESQLPKIARSWTPFDSDCHEYNCNLFIFISFCTLYILNLFTNKKK